MYDLTGYFIGCKHRSKPCTHGTKAENTTLECLTGEISTSNSYGKINVNSTTFCNTMMVCEQLEKWGSDWVTNPKYLSS